MKGMWLDEELEDMEIRKEWKMERKVKNVE